MAAEAAPAIIIIPAVAMGIIIGFIELIFLAKDESGMGWLKHGLHALPTMMIFVFISMNITWAFSLFGIVDSFWMDLGARVAIGLIAMLKTKAAASITGKGGVGESFVHVLIIGVLMMTAPYLWELALKDIVGPYIPF